jgi:hypothetical protein
MKSLSRRRLLGRSVVLGSGAVLLGACAVTPVERDVAVIQVAPPPPRREVIPVLPPDRAKREHWQPGHWRWDGRDYVWVEGRYAVRPRAEAVWIAPRWDRRGSGWVFVEGRWA